MTIRQSAKQWEILHFNLDGNIKIHTDIITHNIFPWETQIDAWSVQEDSAAVTEQACN